MEMFVPFGAQFGVRPSVSVEGQRPKRYDPASQKTQELYEDGVWRAVEECIGCGDTNCYCTGTDPYCSLWGDQYASGCSWNGYGGMNCLTDRNCAGTDYSNPCGDTVC